MSFKKIKEIFLSDNIALIGFLTNLGLITLTFVINLIIKRLISTENLTELWNLNIFSITYILLYVLAHKELLIENAKFKAGFVLAGIIVAILIIKEYLMLFF